MNTEKGSLSQQKLAGSAFKPGLDIFYTPRGSEPLCNQACNGCYYFANYNPGENAIRAEAVPGLVAKFQQDGYGNVFLISSETLLAPNWKEILQAAGDKYINTNGRIIALLGNRILTELSGAGVSQIVITANITPSHELLNLTPKAVVSCAFRNVKSFNADKPEKAFKTVATAILTSENYNKVPEICDYIKEVYGANGVKFIAYIPFSGGNAFGITELSPSLNQLAAAVKQIEEMRKKFKADELYIQRGGSLGTQGLAPVKAKKLCPAGDALHAVKSLAEGAEVTPCIYIPKFPVGRVENGVIAIEENKLRNFLNLKNYALELGYCPAHAMNTANI